MRPWRSLADPANVDEIVTRLMRLDAASGRQWGTLTPNEMLCHLGDSFRATLGERHAAAASTLLQRTVVKWIALHTALPWPQGVPTRPEVDPKRDGTRPTEFDRDRIAVIDLVRRFAAPDTTYVSHPAFGAMTRKEWLLWAYGHVDHHLRQFGV